MDADCALIVGGYSNQNTGFASALVGGYDNCVANSYVFLGAGRGNHAGGANSVVGGGCLNCVTNNGGCSSIVGGYKNVMDHCCGFIGGGCKNCITRPTMSATTFSSIVGGQDNQITGSRSFIAGGCGNIISSDHNDTFIIGSDITAQGDCTTFVNSLAYYAHSDQTTYLGSSNVAGEIVYIGATTVTAGNVYQLSEPSGGTSAWLQTDADSEGTSKGMLAIALGSGASNSVGMLVRGFARFTSVFSLTGGTMGNPIYLSTTAGAITMTAPSGTGDIVRIIGYLVDDTTEVIYFNPDNTYIEIA